MAVITPQTDVYLLKVPLEIDDNNQLTFTNKTAQFNYFNSLPKLEVTDFTYQRKDNTIRYGGNYDSLITYNYVMYRNDAYSNKWFYAFITDMEYLNDNVTAISIKEDCWQTWQFDLNYKPVLIDREHTNDDTIGANTLPEGLELGEMITNGSFNMYYAAAYCVVAEVSQIENTGDGNTLSYEWEDGQGVNWDTTPAINGIVRGTTPLVLSYSNDAPDFDSIRSLYDEAGLGGSIINVYLLPRDLIRRHGNIDGKYLTLRVSNSFGTVIHEVAHILIPNSSNDPNLLDTDIITRPTALSTYEPRNRKLLTYPFCYFNISNCCGNCVTYHYEDFDNVISFNIEGTFCVGGSLKATPVYYKRLNENNNAVDFSVTGGKFPVASWSSDSYTNWMTQNAVNMETQWRTSIISAGADLLSTYIAGGLPGAAMGAIAGAKTLISTAKEQHLAKTQANFVPDQVRGNLNSGDFVWSKYRTPFTYTGMCIKPEYSRCIDQYFDQFGYKCNRVKVPNITGRRNWNYVKTVGCYIEADIPQSSLAEIKALFDRGITFWHNPANFGNYNANNDII